MDNIERSLEIINVKYEDAKKLLAKATDSNDMRKTDYYSGAVNYLASVSYEISSLLNSENELRASNAGK